MGEIRAYPAGQSKGETILGNEQPVDSGHGTAVGRAGVSYQRRAVVPSASGRCALSWISDIACANRGMTSFAS